MLKQFFCSYPDLLFILFSDDEEPNLVTFSLYKFLVMVLKTEETDTYASFAISSGLCAVLQSQVEFQ